MIPIGKIGYIVKATRGVKSGWYVLVEKDVGSDTGNACYVYLSETPPRKDPKLLETKVSKKGYDCWLEHQEHLEEFFQDWIVQWDE